MEQPPLLASDEDPHPLLLGQAARALRAGRPGEAVAPLAAASALRPADARLRHDLGLALMESGRAAEAVVELRHAVAAAPEYADAWFRLGIALEAEGEAGPAVAAYERATRLQPALPEAWFRAGALLQVLGHREEAIGCFRRAADTGGKTPFGRLGAARALLAEDRDDEAERVLRKAVGAEPGNALAHDLLGSLLAESGRFEQAQACFARALALAPLLAGSWYDLVRCRPMTEDDRPLLARMEAALDTPRLDAGQRQRVHLALGKLHDDLGDPAAAMRHFDAADALRAGTTAFDAVAFHAEIDRIIERCTPEALAHAAARGSTDATPVLIIGMPRSGTTLVEQILSSHGAVAAGGELDFWTGRGAAWLRAWSADEEAPLVRQAAAAYLKRLRAIGRKSARVTDKMPFNFLWAGLVHAAFPRATFVHCRRAPVDTAVSIHQTLFHPGFAFPTGGPQLVAYLRGYERLVAHWRAVLPPARFVEVDYESLTADPEPEIRRLVAACGLGWDDACLRPHLNPRTVKTPSKWQARQPIHRASVARWKRYESCLGPLRELV